LAQVPNLPQELTSTRALIRFGLRAIILVTFAAFASIGFGRSLATLLLMSIIFCAVIGTIKREPPFGAALNHWDEVLGYAALFSLVSIFNHAIPT
jgi:hypothetical protein